MRAITWLLSLCAGACALGWLCGWRWGDVCAVAAVGLALLVTPEPGGPGRRP